MKYINLRIELTVMPLYDDVIFVIKARYHSELECLLFLSLIQIETQVKMLLSQETCTPEAMIKLHIEFQKDLCQHIMNFGT